MSRTQTPPCKLIQRQREHVQRCPTRRMRPTIKLGLHYLSAQWAPMRGSISGGWRWQTVLHGLHVAWLLMILSCLQTRNDHSLWVKISFFNLSTMPRSLPYRFIFKQSIARPRIHFKNPYFSPEHHLIIPVIKPATPKVPPFALQWNLT